MADAQASFPFFVSSDPRPLSAQERAIVERLLREQPPRYSEQAGALKNNRGRTTNTIGINRRLPFGAAQRDGFFRCRLDTESTRLIPFCAMKDRAIGDIPWKICGWRFFKDRGLSPVVFENERPRAGEGRALPLALERGFSVALRALTLPLRMDTLTFVSKLVDSLSWPVAAVVLVILLRRQIAAMSPLVKRIKAGPLEAEFEREVREIRQAAVPSKSVGETTPQHLPSIEPLARLNPRAAILEAWRQAEAGAIARLKGHCPELAEAQLRSTREVLRLLRETGLASVEDVELLNQLRFLRNQAAHVDSFQPTYDAAMTFAQSADYLISKVPLGRSSRDSRPREG